MANNFHVLPVPPGDGVGAGVDISDIAPGRTFCVDHGDFSGTLVIQGSQDNVNFLDVPGGVFTSGSQLALRIIASFKFARVRRTGVTTPAGSPTVAVGGPASGTTLLFGTLAVPAGDGVGAATDVSAAGDVLTVLVNLNDVGIIYIEGSEDGVNFSPVLAFGTPAESQFQTALTATFSKIRVRRIQTPGGASTPVVGFGSMVEFTASAPAASETLAQAYAAGAVSADQTLVLLDAKGGGVIIDARNAGFGPFGPAPNGFSLVGVLNGSFRVNKTGNVAIGQDAAALAPNFALLLCRTGVMLPAEAYEARTGGAPIDNWITANVAEQDRPGVFTFKWSPGAAGPFFGLEEPFKIASSNNGGLTGINRQPGIITPFSVALGGAALPDGNSGGPATAAPKGALAATNGSLLPVSLANTGLIRYNEVAQQWEKSENTGAWVPLSGGSSNPYVQPQIIFRPGIASAGEAVATWAEVEAQIAATSGNITVLVDSSIAAAHIPNTAATECFARVRLEAYSRRVGSVFDSIRIDDGGQLKNLAGIGNFLLVNCIATALSPFEFNLGNQAIVLEEGATVYLEATSTFPLFHQTADVLGLVELSGGFLDNSGAPTIACVLIDPGFTLVFRISDASGPIFGTTISGIAGTTLQYIADANSPFVPQSLFAGTLGIVQTDKAAGMSYDDTLVPPPLGATNVQGAIDALKTSSSPYKANNIVFRPGVASSGDHVATWAEVEAVIAATFGNVIVQVDSSLATPRVPNTANTECFARVILRSYRGFIGLGSDILRIDDGGVLRNVAEISHFLAVFATATVRSPFVFDIGDQVFLTNVSGSVSLEAGSTFAFFHQTTDVVAFVINTGGFFDNFNTTPTPVVLIDPGLTMFWIVTDGLGSVVDTGQAIQGDATTTFVYQTDSQSPLPPQTLFLGSLSLVLFDLANGVSYDDTVTTPSLAGATQAQNAIDVLKTSLSVKSGNTAGRPVTNLNGGALLVGQQYFDTTLGKVIVWNGAAWVAYQSAPLDSVPKALVDGGAIAGFDIVENNTFTLTVNGMGHVIAGPVTGLLHMEGVRMLITKTNAGDDIAFDAQVRFANAASSGPTLAGFNALFAAAGAGDSVRVGFEWNAVAGVLDVVSYQGYWS